MGKIVCLTNHKGGVGKTTSAASISAALARRGYKVLAVDLDAQSNLSQSLGADTTQPGIYEALTGRDQLHPVQLFEGLDIVTASRDLSAADVELSQEVGRDSILKRTLQPVRDSYDFIVIDCAPSLGLLTVNAFAAADSVIIPLQAEYLALQGLANLLEIVRKVQQLINDKLVIDAAVVTQYDGRKVLNRNVLDSVRAYFGTEVLTETIRDNVAIAEAPAACQDIFSYAPTSAGAKDYSRLVDKLLERWNK